MKEVLETKKKMGDEQILLLAYGTAGRSAEAKKHARKLLKALRANKELTRREICKHLDFGGGENAARMKFYRIISPLLGGAKSPLGLKFVVRHGNKYSLSRDAFDAGLESMAKNVRYALKT